LFVLPEKEMPLLSMLLFGGLASTLNTIHVHQGQPPQVVQSVDLCKYVGQWYEIARLPNWFERKCVGGVTATYSARPDGRIDVINECLSCSGKTLTARGVARVVDPPNNAKLKVTFFPPFSGDYWILDLGPNYEYSVVGDPNRKYLWILSRTPRMDENLYRCLLGKMAAQGFDVSRMIRTAQP